MFLGQTPYTHVYRKMFDVCMTRMAHSPFMWGNRPFEYISLGLSVVWCRSTGSEIVNLGSMRQRVRNEGYAQANAKIRSCRVCSLGLSTEAWVYFPLKSVSFPLPYIYICTYIVYNSSHPSATGKWTTA